MTIFKIMMKNYENQLKEILTQIGLLFTSILMGL